MRGDHSVSMTPLDIFKETSVQFSAMFAVTKPCVFNKSLGHFQPCFGQLKQVYQDKT